jgi:thioredoxin-related protein
MKAAVLLCMLFMMSCAEHIRWFGNYDKAHQEALKEKKNLMVLLTTRECLSAQGMLKTTFKDQDYIGHLNKKFVSVIVTQGQKESYPIEMLYTMTYPALFFLNTQELFIGENLMGMVTPDRLRRHLDLHVK